VFFFGKTDNCRIYDRSILYFDVFTIEHAKVLLRVIVPRVVPKNGSKIALFIIFFGANDATLKGARQHVHTTEKAI